MKTIVQLTLEVDHDKASAQEDVAARVFKVASRALNGLVWDESRLHWYVPPHGTRGALRVLAAVIGNLQVLPGTPRENR